MSFKCLNGTLNRACIKEPMTLFKLKRGGSQQFLGQCLSQNQHHRKDYLVVYLITICRSLLCANRLICLAYYSSVYSYKNTLLVVKYFKCPSMIGSYIGCELVEKTHEIFTFIQMQKHLILNFKQDVLSPLYNIPSLAHWITLAFCAQIGWIHSCQSH